MNIFFVIRKPDALGGGVELITAPLNRGDILHGVTRSSILDITRGWTAKSNPVATQYGQIEVNERWLTMNEVLQASREGRVSRIVVSTVWRLTCFCCYTVTRSVWRWHCRRSIACERYCL